MIELSIGLNLAIMVSVREAKILKNNNLHIEHILIGLLKIEDLLALKKDVFEEISEKNWLKAKKEINDFVTLMISNNIDCKKLRRKLRELLWKSDYLKGHFSGHRTPQCKELFTYVEQQCKEHGETQVTLQHMFFGIMTKKTRLIQELFELEKINLSLLVKEMNCEGRSLQNESMNIKEKNHSNTPFLDKYGKDLTQLASKEHFDPVIGRDKEMKKLAQILAQKRKSNPILIGEAGVGKTCIVEGFASMVVQANASSRIRNYRIIELNLGSLIAGTSLRGEFEEKLNRIIVEASTDPDIILFIDEIHTIIGAGSGGSALDASNIFKPALARSDIKCIGATTINEYRNNIEKDPAFERRFQVIWVEEPTPNETVDIIMGIKQKYEHYHGVKITKEIIKKAVELSQKYIADFYLPDKAIDIIDQACSRKTLVTLHSKEVDNGILELDIYDVAAIVSERSKIPFEVLTESEYERLLKLEDYLNNRILGQDHVIKQICESILTAKVGLKEQQKPLGVFLFLGSSGTGKTELAKCLAEYLFNSKNNMITIDMSEYKEKGSISKLIGAPPGYIGYDHEGQLTGKVRSKPYSIILFDEIEKAHPEVMDIFLQIFDEGRLTDSRGRRVNFSETIIILTSNIGSHKNKTMRRIGFNYSNKNKQEEVYKIHTDNILQSVKEVIRPEILNRIQKILIFNPLTKVSIIGIIDKFVAKLNDLLKSKNIVVILNDYAKDFLIREGYNEEYGAREIDRTIEKYIKEPISAMILSGEIKDGSSVSISYSDDALDIQVN